MHATTRGETGNLNLEAHLRTRLPGLRTPPTCDNHGRGPYRPTLEDDHALDPWTGHRNG